MDKSKINLMIESIMEQMKDLATEINAPDVVEESNLPAALREGGLIPLKLLGRYGNDDGFVIAKSKTTIEGQKSILVALKKSALYVLPSTNTVQLIELEGMTEWDQNVFQFGKNDDLQNTTDVEPYGITLIRCFINSYRGKHAIEINARDVTLESCTILDIYDSAGRDSQAVWIGNSSGQILIDGCTFEAASENLMVGGDTMKMVGIHPTGIVIKNSDFRKNFGWKGVVPVKNLLELKDGWGVTIQNSTFSNCWASGQAGECFMFTPKSGGQVDVTVVDCLVRNVASIVNITGKDNSTLANPTRTRVQFLGGDYRTDKTNMGGRGIFGVVTGGPEYIKIDGIYCRHTGSSFLDIDRGVIDRLDIQNSNFNYGSYGIRLAGNNNGDNIAGTVKELVIRNNSILGANEIFKKRFPENIWL